MAQQQLIAMMGLPRSGKSTYVKEVLIPRGFAVVGGDEIRLALHGQRFASEAEPMVAAIAEVMFKALKLAGCDIVVDETNVSEKRRNRWLKLGVQQFVVIETPKETCIERALATNQPDLVSVIERMAEEWEPYVGMGTEISKTLS